jgi:hypothetical protein
MYITILERFKAVISYRVTEDLNSSVFTQICLVGKRLVSKDTHTLLTLTCLSKKELETKQQASTRGQTFHWTFICSDVLEVRYLYMTKLTRRKWPEFFQSVELATRLVTSFSLSS